MHLLNTIYGEIKMKAVITVVGHDSMGIIAKVSTVCAEVGANIEDISQSVLKDYFAMVMVVDIDKLNIPFNGLVDKLTDLGKQNSLDIRTMHEDIFNSMHRI
jgi:ACT domain-containing protein